MREGSEKKLTLAEDNVFLGVAGGLAQYYNIKPVYIRALLIVAGIFFNFITLIIYLIFYAFMPKPYRQLFVNKEDSSDGIDSSLTYAETLHTSSAQRKSKRGYTLLVIGLVCVAASAGPLLVLPVDASKNTLTGLWFMFTIFPSAGVLILGVILSIIHYSK